MIDATIVVGTALTATVFILTFLYVLLRAPKKKPNPDIKLMEKHFTLVPIKRFYSRHSWIAYRNAREFIDLAEKDARAVWVLDESSHMFYFYHLEGYDFCIEIPKLVKA